MTLCHGTCKKIRLFLEVFYSSSIAGRRHHFTSHHKTRENIELASFYLKQAPYLDVSLWRLNFFTYRSDLPCPIILVQLIDGCTISFQNLKKRKILKTTGVSAEQKRRNIHYIMKVPKYISIRTLVEEHLRPNH
jgi:hypothetical protein